MWSHLPQWRTDLRPIRLLGVPHSHVWTRSALIPGGSIIIDSGSSLHLHVGPGSRMQESPIALFFGESDHIDTKVDRIARFIHRCHLTFRFGSALSRLAPELSFIFHMMTFRVFISLSRFAFDFLFYFNQCLAAKRCRKWRITPPHSCRLRRSSRELRTFTGISM
jgi:hypothetical protein